MKWLLYGIIGGFLLPTPILGGDLSAMIAQLRESEIDTRPIVIGNSIAGCVQCEVDKAADTSDFPFQIIWRENYEFDQTYPVYQFPHSTGMYSHWNVSMETLQAHWQKISDKDLDRYSERADAELNDDVVTEEEYEAEEARPAPQPARRAQVQQPQVRQPIRYVRRC